MTSQEQMDYYNQMQEELVQERERSRQLGQGMQSQANLFDSEQNDNLIRWQLDLKEDLERIYHLLKGDIVKEDGEGNIYYKKQKNPHLRPFNEYGVQTLMNILSFYLSRNTLLSNYDAPTIDWKIYDFGIVLSDLIHNKYNTMMVTIKQGEEESNLDFRYRVEDHLKEKIKLYPMIIGELVDTVHSAYLRAYRGGERESLRTARTVTQTEPLSAGFNMNPGSSMGSQTKRRRFLNPTTWFG